MSGAFESNRLAECFLHVEADTQSSLSSLGLLHPVNSQEPTPLFISLHITFIYKQQLLSIIESGFGEFDSFNRLVRTLLVARLRKRRCRSAMT